MKSYGQFYVLLKQVCEKGHMDAKETKVRLVEEVSIGRTGHLGELTDAEYTKLIECLNTLFSSTLEEAKTPPGDRIRKSIFSMCYTMNLIRNEQTNTDKLKAIDAFIAGHSKIGNKKPLMQYSVKELNDLHYQFEVFTKHYLSKI